MEIGLVAEAPAFVAARLAQLEKPVVDRPGDGELG
jgi:hypothetical protein